MHPHKKCGESVDTSEPIIEGNMDLHDEGFGRSSLMTFSNDIWNAWMWCLKIDFSFRWVIKIKMWTMQFSFKYSDYVNEWRKCTNCRSDNHEDKSSRRK